MPEGAAGPSSSVWSACTQPISVDAGVNILSVDVECWDWIICRKLTGGTIPHSRHVPSSVDRLMTLFAAKKARATFFVVGALAEAFPEVVRRIDEAGHEVAAHGYSHRPITGLTRQDFRDEVRRSVETIAGIIGKPVIGFRAPEFSIVAETVWALEILAECGIAYDSSIFPFAGPRYGMPDFPPQAVRIDLGGRSIIEMPPSVARVWGRNLPVAGGGYFRLLPYGVTRRAVERVREDGRPFVLYLHSYEFEPRRLSTYGFPRPLDPWAASKVRMASNLRKGSVHGKLERLLETFRFTAMREALRDALPA